MSGTSRSASPWGAWAKRPGYRVRKSAHPASRLGFVRAETGWSSVFYLLYARLNFVAAVIRTNAPTAAMVPCACARLISMTNPGEDAGQTPSSDSGGGGAEPSSGGYEAPAIEQSQEQSSQPETPQPAEQPAYTPPPAYTPSSGYETPSYPAPDYQQASGYPPSNFSPPDYPPPPPDYSAPGGAQPGYPPPYPGPPGYGAQSYPP